VEWLSDPTVWAGLVTLVVLEIVLGIDNLIFIAILADKLPRHQRDRARRLGLALALFTRLALLASISWVMSLTATLFTILSMEISWRGIILIAGGAFLLIKATIEIHDRLEAVATERPTTTGQSRFWLTIVQIVVLDIVFSLDSVITAVGMVDELYVMMAAVIIAVAVMLVASKPLTDFITAHPSLVILCLGFLLMVGFVLVADGVGYHIPKGYLYAAIGFSVLIEIFNQLALRNRLKLAGSVPRRQRAADAVLRLLGGVPLTAAPAAATTADVNTLMTEENLSETFAPAEKEMMRGVLTLAERPVQAIMTPRPDINWLDPDDSKETILAKTRESAHRQFLVSRGSIDEVVGLARKEDILELVLDDQPFELQRVMHEPVAVRAGASILKTLEVFKQRPIEMALVVEEYGAVQGIVTRTDLLAAIAGDLPQAGSHAPELQEVSEGVYTIDGALSIYDAQQRLGLTSVPDGDFHTVAGLVLFLFGRLPAPAEHVQWNGWDFEVVELDGWRIAKISARQCAPNPATSTAAAPEER